MPWHIHIDPELNCVFVKYYGDFEIDQIRGAAEDVSNHPDYREGMNFLRDCREQKISKDISFHTLADEAHSVFDKYDPERGHCRTAIVAGDAESYSKIHQYVVSGRLSHTGVERMAFRDIAKAKEWLGLPKDYKVEFPGLI